ncbi:hypothetical protein ACIQU4_19315 [Streptomyces sp. NPDC090741]
MPADPAALRAVSDGILSPAGAAGAALKLLLITRWSPESAWWQRP